MRFIRSNRTLETTIMKQCGYYTGFNAGKNKSAAGRHEAFTQKAAHIPLSKLVLLSPFIVMFLYAAWGCHGQNSQKPAISRQEMEQHRKNLEATHRGLAKLHADSIKNHAATMGWNMAQTPTGLWYQITEAGEGEKIQTGSVIYLKYQLSVLNGKKCYSSDSLGYKSFSVGMGGVEAGLEEAVLLLRKGDKARIIFPPYLGHGITGDFNCIPPVAILMYELQVMEVFSNW
jgi:FKBP-type peptidyl-prolyl cis-trans isomerase FkpA